MEPALRRFSRGVLAAVPQPLPYRLVEDGRDRQVANSRFPLQIRLDLGGHAPAIDFCFHALQCSTLEEILPHVSSQWIVCTLPPESDPPEPPERWRSLTCLLSCRKMSHRSPLAHSGC